jgi:hypothetical protein
MSDERRLEISLQEYSYIAAYDLRLNTGFKFVRGVLFFNAEGNWYPALWWIEDSEETVIL